MPRRGPPSVRTVYHTVSPAVYAVLRLLNVGSVVNLSGSLKLPYVRFDSIQGLQLTVPPTVEPDKELYSSRDEAIERAGYMPRGTICQNCGESLPVVQSTAVCTGCGKKLGLSVPLKYGCTIKDKGLSIMNAKLPVETNGLTNPGPIVPRCPYFTTRSSKESVMIALIKRQLVLTNPCTKKTWAKAWEVVTSNIGILFPGLPVDLKPKDFFLWVCQSNMSPMVKKRLIATYVRDSDVLYSDDEIEFYSRIDLFTKRDKYNNCGFFDFDAKFFNRAISPFKPEALVSTGPAVSALQSAFHHSMSGWLKFAAGCNNEELSQWFADVPAGWRIMYNDFTFYDSSIGVEAQKFLARLYGRTGIYDNTLNFKNFKYAQSIDTKGTTRYGVHFRVRGTMKSGASDTCLGNTILNFVSHVLSLCKLNHCSVEHLSSHMRMIAMGDDNVFFLSPELTTVGLANELAEYGFTSKLQTAERMEDFVFLNLRLTPVAGGGYKLGNLAGRLISRLGWTTKTPEDPTAFMGDVALAFDKSTRHVPLLRTYIQRLLFLASRKNSENLGRNKLRTVGDVSAIEGWQYKVQTAEASDICEAGIQNTCRIYSITRQDYDSLDKYLANIPSMRVSLDHPVLDRICTVDVGG